MKKLMIAMLGLSFVLTTVTPVLRAQDTTKKTKKTKTKATKAKKTTEEKK